MSNIDELVQIFISANDSPPGTLSPRTTPEERLERRMAACRAGIAAVVRALRDEMRTHCYTHGEPECCGRGVPNYNNTAEECCGAPTMKVTDEIVIGIFNEILGHAVDEVAGGPTLATAGGVETNGQVSRSTSDAPAADFVPCAVCGPNHSWGRQEHCRLNGCAYSRENSATILRPPTTEPSVCVWTMGATLAHSACGSEAVDFPDTQCCPSCGKPISFKEPTK